MNHSMSTIYGRTIGRHGRKLRRMASEITNVPVQFGTGAYLMALRLAIDEFKASGKKPRGAAYDYAVSRGMS